MPAPAESPDRNSPPGENGEREDRESCEGPELATYDSPERSDHRQGVVVSGSLRTGFPWGPLILIRATPPPP